MRNACIWTSAAAAVCLLLAAPAKTLSGEPHDHRHAAVGTPAPLFNLNDSNGKEHSLAAILKKDDVKAVVLEWFNHTCPVCTRIAESKSVINMVNSYKDKGVVFLGIDSTHFNEGKESAINDQIKKWGVNYPILTDFDGKVGHTYAAKTTPHMFIIDKKGILVYEGAIDDDPRGNKSVSERTNYVTAALDQVLAGETVAIAHIKSYGCSVKYKQ